MLEAILIFGAITVVVIGVFAYTLYRVNKDMNFFFDNSDDENDGIY
jgi:hypothetical protein